MIEILIFAAVHCTINGYIAGITPFEEKTPKKHRIVIRWALALLGIELFVFGSIILFLYGLYCLIDLYVLGIKTKFYFRKLKRTFKP